MTRIAVALAAVGALIVAALAGTTPAGAGEPWDGDGHCQFGSVYDPPVDGVYMTEFGHVLRQCNSTSTASHGDADVGGGANGFWLYRTTGGSQQICSGGKCGYRWYLRYRGWIHCAWTTAVC
jgi:hypothetical protein